MFGIVVHGGAGGPPQPLREELESLPPAARTDRFAKSDTAEALRAAARAGYEVLEASGQAWDAVEAAVVVLEDSGQFNAGAGSNPQLDGIARMDASLMDGRDLSFGAALGVAGVKNPIRLARRIAEDTPHVCVAGDGARNLAEHFGLELAEPPRKEPRTAPPPELIQLYHEMYGDTVGAVALDTRGDLAAATSTGGIQHMLPGRVGDTPFIGCGAYADNDLAAISTTGQGELIIRSLLAARTCWALQQDLSLDAAAQQAVKFMTTRLGGRGGLVAINRQGDLAIVHSSAALVSASQRAGEDLQVRLTGTRVTHDE